MRRTRLLVVVALWIAVAGLKAQNPVAGPTSKFEWNQGADVLSDAQGFTYRYYLDAAGPATFVNVSCTGAASPYTCTVLVPAMGQGTHTFTMTATSAAGESAHSSPFAFAFIANPPSMPTNLRIVP